MHGEGDLKMRMLIATSEYPRQADERFGSCERGTDSSESLCNTKNGSCRIILQSEWADGGGVSSGMGSKP